jgi:hypothetical protein
MKKKQRQMIVLLAVLVVLGAAFFGLKQYNKVQAEKPEEVDGEVILDVDASDLVRISFDYEGETYTFEKEEDTWYYAEDHDLPIYQYRINALADILAPFIAQQVIENVGDMSTYGLTEPQKTITFETATESYILYVGDKNSVTSGYYVSFPSEANVYVMGASDINKFNITVDDVVNTSELESEEASDETESAETETSEAVESTGEASGEAEAEVSESASGEADVAESTSAEADTASASSAAQ